MIDETQKIFDCKIEVLQPVLELPVFVGHAESIYIETKKKIDLKKLITKIKKFPGLSLVDEQIDGGMLPPMNLQVKMKFLLVESG